MNIYKHIVYNPKITNLTSVIEEAQSNSGGFDTGGIDKEWKFDSVKIVNEYEWVAIFEKFYYPIDDNRYSTSPNFWLICPECMKKRKR